MPKYLGIDYGLERTGLAVTDPDGKLVFPFATLKLEDYKRRSDLLDDLAKRIHKEKIDEVVIGLPLYADGNENLRCAQARNFAARLRHRIDLPVHFEPETFTSQEAERILKEIGMKKDKLKQVLDQQAACLILQSFLARQRQ